MGRRRQAAQRNPQQIESPFPSSPTRPPKYSLVFSDQEGRIYTPGFATCFGAKKAVDYILSQSEWEWISKTTIRAFSKEENRYYVDIKSEELEEIVEYAWLNQAEAEWELPTPYPRDLDRICGIKYDPRISEQYQRDERRSESKVDESSTGAKGPRGHKPRVDDNEGAKPGRSRKDADFTTLAQLCEELKLDPRKARVALRGKIDKPEGGWSWPASDVERIKKLLK